MYLKKIIAGILTLFIMTSIMAGCGSGKKISSEVKQKEETIDLKGYTVKLPLNQRMEPVKGSLTYDDEMNLIKKLEKKYNCKITFVDCGNNSALLSKIITTTLAGDPYCDIYYENSVWSVPILFVKNIVQPLDGILDLSLKQWDKSITKIGTYKGKHYTFWGRNLTCSCGIYFNKRIFES